MAVYYFRKDPGSETFQDAKDLWIEARKPTEKPNVSGFRKRPSINLIKILINAWPVDESYIDYT